MVDSRNRRELKFTGSALPKNSDWMWCSDWENSRRSTHKPNFDGNCKNPEMTVPISNLIEKGWSSNKKPYLKNIPNLRYSVSHSGNKCIVGISNQYEIGLDIEFVSRYNDIDMQKYIRNIISEKELPFAECGTSDLQRALVIWTKKEALFKSVGNGSLTQFLKRKLSYEEVKSVKSFLIDDYIVSIASVAENIKIIDAEDIGLRNIINQIKAWMHI